MTAPGPPATPPSAAPDRRIFMIGNAHLDPVWLWPWQEGYQGRRGPLLDRSRTTLMVFYGVGNHGGGPTRANIDSIRHWDRMGGFGQLIMNSPRACFDQTLAAGADDLPVWTGDLQHHAAGCYSSHSGIKARQRRAQAEQQWRCLLVPCRRLAYRPADPPRPSSWP